MTTPKTWLALGETAAPGQSDARPRVLVVDDEEVVARALARLLWQDYAVTVAYSGMEALARLERGERFAAILSDVSMPIVDGMELYRRCAQLAPELRVSGFVFLTGGHVSEVLHRFLETYGQVCLEKPFSPSQLKALLSRRVAAPTLPAAPL